MGPDDSVSFGLARTFLGRCIRVEIDRPLGSRHPRHGFVYEVNYGHIPETLAPDGEGLDAYVLGVDVPLAEFSGECIAVIHRLDDDDDKLVVVPPGTAIRDGEIEALVSFQEKWFKHEIIRKQ